MEKAAEVYALAKSAVVLAQKTSVTKTLVQEAANQLTAIFHSAETYRSEMNKLASQLPEYPVVMEMYGVGESLGPQLMAEIGDVRRFERKQSLVAFVGIDPAPSESGDYCSRSNRTTKRGSPYLRKTLLNIMTVHLQRAPADEPVFQFLDKKCAEGKPYYVYMTAAGNKFLRRYYGKVMAYFATLEGLPARGHEFNRSAPHRVTDCNLPTQVSAFAVAFLCCTFSLPAACKFFFCQVRFGA